MRHILIGGALNTYAVFVVLKAPAHLRAFASLLLVIAFTLLGMGLAPLVTGLIGDYLVVHYGMAKESLRYAIVLCAPLALWAACHYHRAAWFLPQDIERAETLPVPAAHLSPLAASAAVRPQASA